MNDELRRQLEGQIDEKYRAFNQRLLPGTPNILGVRMPVIKKIVRSALRDGTWKAWLLPDPGRDYYEEVMAYGLAIASAKLTDEAHWALLDDFVPLIDNWAVCDCCCAACGFIERDPDKSLPWLLKWLGSGREFETRFVLACLLDYYAGKEENALWLLDICARIHCEGYYAQMAAAWLIAEIAVFAPAHVETFLCGEGMADQIVGAMAVRKIKESRRVSDEYKTAIRTGFLLTQRRKRDTHENTDHPARRS